MLGSPGGPAQSVRDLHVKDGNVWVGEAAWDPVPNSSFFGSDPGSASYGAHLMSVDGGEDAVTGRALSASIGHLGYFGTDSEGDAQPRTHLDRPRRPGLPLVDHPHGDVEFSVGEACADAHAGLLADAE